MKTFNLHWAFVLTLLLSLNAFGQLQRLSILPQSGIKITNTAAAGLKSISIDYYSEAPNSLNTKNQAAYNQVYSNDEVTIKINGLKATKTFQSLVQSDNPLLLLIPTSISEVGISINPNNPESRKIKSIEVAFNSPIEIGNIKGGTGILQSQTIFKNWGNDISQEDFWNRAKCLDILNQNKKLTYQPENQITASSKQQCDKLLGTMDFSIFSGKTFRTLVLNNCFVLDEDLSLTTASMQTLQQCFYYEQSLKKTKEINSHWIEYGKMITNTTAGFDRQIAYSAKPLFYEDSKNLTNLDKDNKAIRDTLINGNRYVLMVAWKSGSFMDYVTKSGNTLPTYKSNPALFTYPLFLTPKADMERWANNSSLNSLNETQCNTRLMQLLGLPPNSTNNTFVEFWAYEDDVFRPAIDPSLKSSLLLFKLSPEYLNAFAKFSNGSFDNDNFLQQYPFTGLGYTWDYNPENPKHIGVTEFVLKENRTVYIRKTVPTKDYISTLVSNINK